MATTHNDILRDLKAQKYAPIYFLQAEEPYFIDLVVEYIEKNVLNDGEKSFNQVVLYGKETNFKQVLDQAMQFPMMASHRVIIVKEAQAMLSLEKLENYFKKPAEQTILVLAHKHKKLDKRKKKVWDGLKKNAVILDSGRLYDNKIPPYIIEMAAEKGLKIDTKVAAMITENLGSDLSKIANEINKLSLNLSAGTTVTLDHVETYVGISKDYNIFELQKALGQKDKVKAYKIINHFSRNSKANPIQPIVAMLYSYFAKLYIAKKYQNTDNRTFASKIKVNPFFADEYKRAAKNYELPSVTKALTLVHNMDKKSKGVESRRYTELGVYQEFLFQLFN